MKGDCRWQNDIALAVQKDMDALNSGVEILAVIVEAIHPPAGASNAFHGVQAAQISAEALVARERGKAAEEMKRGSTQCQPPAETRPRQQQERI